MAVPVDRSRRGETLAVERFHEGKLFHGRYAGQVEPAGVRPALEVVSVVLDRAEGGPAKSRKLDDHSLSLGVLTDVDVTLLTDSNLDAHLLNVPSLHEGLESQVVIAHVGKGIAVILLVEMHNHLVLKQELDHLEGVSALQSGQALNKRHWYELVVLHAHLDGSQHAEVLLCQVVNQVRV